MLRDKVFHRRSEVWVAVWFVRKACVGGLSKSAQDGRSAAGVCAIGDEGSPGGGDEAALVLLFCFCFCGGGIESPQRNMRHAHTHLHMCQAVSSLGTSASAPDSSAAPDVGTPSASHWWNIAHGSLEFARGQFNKERRHLHINMSTPAVTMRPQNMLRLPIPPVDNDMPSSPQYQPSLTST